MINPFCPGKTMEAFMPKRSKTSQNILKQFERIWFVLIVFFLVLLFGMREYKQGKSVHTNVMEDISKIKFRLELLEKT